MKIHEKVFIDKKKQEPQVHDKLKYRRGSACCCLSLLLALHVPFSMASRKKLWSHYGEVALAARLAHLCSKEC